MTQETTSADERKRIRKAQRHAQAVEFRIKQVKLPLPFYLLLERLKTPFDILNYYKPGAVSLIETFIEDFFIVKPVPDDTLDYLKDIKESISGVKEFPGLFIGGRSNTGKTTLASYIVYTLIQNHASDFRKGCQFLNVPDFLESMRPGRANDAGLIDRAYEVDLLVLDDFGAEVMTSWVFERLYCIINKRMNDLRPIIYTSNLSFADLGTALNKVDPVAAARILTRVKSTCTILSIK